LKRFGLPKEHLLRKSGDFEQVYKQGKRLYGDGFTLICHKNSFGFNRIGVSVHRQIKGAVKRNRIKRIIRESFRLGREQYPLNSDIVFAVRPGFLLNSPGTIGQAVSLLTHVVNESDNY
jgi:ribonuclease P protein component